jgi:hypothetical protein
MLGSPTFNAKTLWPCLATLSAMTARSRMALADVVQTVGSGNFAGLGEGHMGILIAARAERQRTSEVADA